MRKEQTVEDLLKSARELIPCTDALLNARAARSKTRNIKTFMYLEFLINREWQLAWDELYWAAERVDAACALSGMHFWDYKHKNSRMLFWRYMAEAARKMIP
jgi:hypothetical protein